MDFSIAIALIIVIGYVLMKYCSPTRKSSTHTENQPSAVYPKLDLKPDAAVRSNTRQRPITLDSTMSTGGKIGDQDLFYRLMGQMEENNTLKGENQRLVSQVTQFELELSTLNSEHGELFQSVRAELIATRCQLDAKNRDMAHLESTILDFKNYQTSLKKDAAVDAERIEELNVQYKKACARNTSMHREVRGLHAARARLQREKATLVNQLEMKTRELEEEKATSDKKLKDLQMENEENLIRVRNFHQTLNNKRNSKMNELEEIISDLNLTMVENEEDHRTEMEEMRASYSIVIQKRDEQLVQLESTVEELSKKNCELTDAVDELEADSYALPDYYKILNLKRKATEEEIKLAYQNRIRHVHPDKVQQMQQSESDEKVLIKAKNLSQALNRAKDILNSPRLRYQYDSWLDMTELKKTEQKMRDYEAYEDRKRNRN